MCSLQACSIQISESLKIHKIHKCSRTRTRISKGSWRPPDPLVPRRPPDPLAPTQTTHLTSPRYQSGYLVLTLPVPV